jgi:hypothetical protein
MLLCFEQSREKVISVPADLVSACGTQAWPSLGSRARIDIAIIIFLLTGVEIQSLVPRACFVYWERSSAPT